MKTIYKLVLKSYLGPMVLTFFIIMFVLMMNVLWRYIDELVGKGLDPGTIIELLCYATINMIPMALPLATLLAAIMTMGNLGENYELLAMKSAGMSLPKIMRPLLVVVSILAVGSFFIANNLVPYANKKFFRTIYDIRQMNQTLEFQDGLFFLIGAPLGAIVRRGGLGMPIVISVIFFVIYYIISSSGEKMAKEGTWEAFYGTWLSAFVLAPVAIYLTYKATNDSGLLDVDWYVVKFKKIKEKISGIFARFAHKNKK